MTDDDTLNKQDPQKELKKVRDTLGIILQKLVFDIFIFLAVAVLISLAWNFYVVDILKDFVILPQVTPIQVVAFKMVLNYINPFK